MKADIQSLIGISLKAFSPKFKLELCIQSGISKLKESGQRDRSTYDVFYVTAQFLERLKATVLTLQIFAKHEIWAQKQFQVLQPLWELLSKQFSVPKPEGKMKSQEGDGVVDKRCVGAFKNTNG